MGIRHNSSTPPWGERKQQRKTSFTKPASLQRAINNVYKSIAYIYTFIHIFLLHLYIVYFRAPPRN